MSHTSTQNESEISIRTARDGDVAALRRLAQRDSSAIPSGRLLIASVDGRARAAISLSDPSRAIADPFVPTAHLLSLLRIEAASRATAERRRPRAGSLRNLRSRTALRSAVAWR